MTVPTPAAATPSATPVSGTAITLKSGEYTAAIASVGASLRALRHGERDLVVPFDADEVRPAYRGATLAPWPNRVADGRYTFGGIRQQLPLTEPERGNALHGLACWLDYRVVEREDARVLLTATIEAQTGYPHRVEVWAEFELDDHGLHTTVTAHNTGTDAAPWGTGPHPYLVAGPGRVDDWTLALPAARVLTVTDDRLLPRDIVDVTAAVASDIAGAFDFRAPRRIGDVFIDHAFTGLTRESSGIATLELRTDDGSGVAMSWDAACSWVQVHTADQPDSARSRLGLAVEPMTCPPDAFNSQTDLVVLEPDDSASASWTISAL